MREGYSEHVPAPDEHRKTEEFGRFFPEGEVLDTALTEMPDDVQELLEQLGMRYLDIERYEPGKFHDVQKVTLGPDDAIYVARKIKEYGDAGTEESTYLVDHKDGKVAGYGEVRYHLTDESGYFKDKPFVGFTRTGSEHQRSGLAERRLRAMNALARQKYGKPLYSDTLLSPEARSLWEKLVKEGRARKFSEGEQERFVYEDQ